LRLQPDRVGPGLAGADADRFLDRRYKNLAISDAAGLGGLADRFDGGVDEPVGQHDLELHLGEEVDHVLGASVQLGVALLAPEALGLDDRDALQPHVLQGLLHLVELERLDDGFDLLHGRSRAPSEEDACAAMEVPLLASGPGPFHVRFRRWRRTLHTAWAEVA
jgi:hypothetical protein